MVQAASTPKTAERVPKDPVQDIADPIVTDGEITLFLRIAGVDLAELLRYGKNFLVDRERVLALPRRPQVCDSARLTGAILAVQAAQAERI
jgi:hypothetical protein